MTISRTPSTALQWFPYTAANESAILDMANSRQIALRTRLRNHYWLTECKLLTDGTITLTRRKMTMIDPKDKMSDAEVAELLSDHYGFIPSEAGWTIPDLIQSRQDAIEASRGRTERAIKGGLARAAQQAAAKVPAEAPSPSPQDF